MSWRTLALSAPAAEGDIFSLHHFRKKGYHADASAVDVCRMDGRAENWSMELAMATVIQHEELVRRALQYIAERRQACPDLSVYDLLDEAGIRFNLSRRDQEALERLYREQTGGDKA